MAGQLTIDTLRASTGVLATQNGMTGIAKAWVIFNGTLASPTPISQFNTSSITKNATGNYTLTFTTAMTDANYSFYGLAGREVSGNANLVLNNGLGDTKTTTQLQVRSSFGTTATDSPMCCVAVLGS